MSDKLFQVLKAIHEAGPNGLSESSVRKLAGSHLLQVLEAKKLAKSFFPDKDSNQLTYILTADGLEAFESEQDHRNHEAERDAAQKKIDKKTYLIAVLTLITAIATFFATVFSILK